MNYVQNLKAKIEDAIYECINLEEYLEKIKKGGQHVVSIDEVERRVLIIRSELRR